MIQSVESSNIISLKYVYFVGKEPKYWVMNFNIYDTSNKHKCATLQLITIT